MAKELNRQDLYNDKIAFDKLLIQMRKDKGITQRELAEYLGVKTVTVSAYEKGRIMPPPDKIYKLTKLFGVNVDVISKKIVGESAELDSGEIPELEIAKRQVAKMDEMLYYFKNLSVGQQKAVINLTKRLSNHVQ